MDDNLRLSEDQVNQYAQNLVDNNGCVFAIAKTLCLNGKLTNKNGDVFSFMQGKLHSFNDQPSIVETSGSQLWHQNGILHRDNDLPAVIHTDGSLGWFQNGQFHRDNDKPAFIDANGDQYWCQNGKVCRDNDQPAFIGMDGSQWPQNCEIHRNKGIHAVEWN